MAAGPHRVVALGAVTAGLVLLLAAPTPAACGRTLAAAGSATDPSAPLVALLALAAWALAGWLVATVLLTSGGHLPGQVGRALRPLARRVAPAAVRRGVEVALGLTVAVGTLASPAAAATPAHEATRPVGAPVTSLDWSAPAPDAPAPDLDWSAPAEPVAPAPTAAPAPAAPATVVVQPGDTLWDLAEQELRDRGPATRPSQAEVAAAWPAWWSANREAVGDDPHLLQPGTPLTRPEPG